MNEIDETCKFIDCDYRKDGEFCMEWEPSQSKTKAEVKSEN